MKAIVRAVFTPYSPGNARVLAAAMRGLRLTLLIPVLLSVWAAIMTVMKGNLLAFSLLIFQVYCLWVITCLCTMVIRTAKAYLKDHETITEMERQFDA